jgi:16S rRNA (cytosine967-C5)-methyltransferase
VPRARRVAGSAASRRDEEEGALPQLTLAFTADEAARIAEGGDLRPLAARAFEEERARGWPFLSDVLAGVFRSARAMEADRGIVTAAVHGLVKYDRLLTFALGEGATAGARIDALTSMAPDVDERLARIELVPERLAVTYSLPDWLVHALREDFGEAVLERACARLDETAPQTARVNTLKATREVCLARLGEEGVSAHPTKHAAAGLVVQGRRSIFRTRAFAEGLLEAQDEASQLVAELVAPPPGGLVVDACAGAGGKTLALAALLGNKGRVVALDPGSSAIEELRRRARRGGASNVQPVVAALGEAGSDEALARWQGQAHRVLVDAPCSGLGAIRRNPEARWRLRPEQLASLVAGQASLLRAARALSAPNGRLVYATCSPLRREGEAIVEGLLAEDASFTLVTARDVFGRARSDPFATPDGRYLRTWRFEDALDAGTQGMDGFFAAVVRRKA